jgi:hypothetical protein
MDQDFQPLAIQESHSSFLTKSFQTALVSSININGKKKQGPTSAPTSSLFYGR